MRHAYAMRKNYQHNIASYKRTGYEVGKARGLAEGRAEGLAERKAEDKAEVPRDMARKMKAIGMPVDDIAKITGLSAEEIGLV
jgi:predicted transposase/invertase (TIGR01784 family)